MDETIQWEACYTYKLEVMERTGLYGPFSILLFGDFSQFSRALSYLQIVLSQHWFF